jgi:hypothetical protein
MPSADGMNASRRAGIIFAGRERKYGSLSVLTGASMGLYSILYSIRTRQGMDK